MGAPRHHERPLGRERGWGLGHRRPPARLRRGGPWRVVHRTPGGYKTWPV